MGMTAILRLLAILIKPTPFDPLFLATKTVANRGQCGEKYGKSRTPAKNMKTPKS
jgi:hypothetical protein